MSNTVDIGEIVARAFQLLRDDARKSIPAIILMSLVGIAFDYAGSGVLLANFAVSLYFQTAITRSTMTRLGLAEQHIDSNPYGLVFAVGLLSGLGILFGLIFLVIPGLMLAVRWFVAVPAIFGNASGASNALDESWKLVKPNFWPMLGVMLIYVFIALGPTILVEILIANGGFWESNSKLIHVAMNVESGAGLVIGWYLAVSAYEALASHRETLAEIFA